MAQQTAVDWLVNEYFGGLENCTPWFIKHIEQAKQMEKEQIIKTAIVCHFEGVRQSAKTSEGYIIYGKQYYNETYNK